MITFKKVTEADEQLNSQIEELNRKVFPSAETTANLHFPTQNLLSDAECKICKYKSLIISVYASNCRG